MTNSIEKRIKEIVYDVEAGQLDPQVAAARLFRLFKFYNRDKIGKPIKSQT